MNQEVFRSARRRFLRLSLRAALATALPLGSLATAALADDREQARNVANDILAMLDTDDFERVWDMHASNYLKSKLDRDSFVASVAIGRASLGKRMSSSVLGVELAEQDAASGYESVVYTVRMDSVCRQGHYVEQIVLVKEADGQLRLAGLWGLPTAKQ
jgi:hypothetical protein